MKNVVFILLCAFLFATMPGCKKESSSPGDGSTNVYSDKIVLSNLQTSSDSVVLTWSILNNPKFSRYMIIRRDYKSTNPNTYNSYEVIDDITDAATIRYVDRSAPATTYLEYQVIGALKNTEPYYSYTYVYSNVVPYERPELKHFYFNIKDVLPDLPNHRCYIIGADSGKISILDYQTRTISNEIFTYATLGFSSLGNFNGIPELYIPRNDGWVFIYNANTLAKIDQIKAGPECYSVVYNNGKLFIAIDSGYYDCAVKVFDRSTKSMIEYTGLQSSGPQHLALMPGSDTKLFGIGSYYLYSFVYDANGQYVSWGSVNNNSGSGNLKCFEMFPNGQGFITARDGSIYSNSMVLIQNLPYGNYQFSSYAFNSPFTSIFAGCSNYKNIVEYSVQGFSEKYTYKCSGYPTTVFVDGTSLISLSSTYSFGSYDYGHDFIIETIPMNGSRHQ